MMTTATRRKPAACLAMEQEAGLDGCCTTTCKMTREKVGRAFGAHAVRTTIKNLLYNAIMISDLPAKLCVPRYQY